MSDQDVIIGLVANGKLLCSGAARALNMTPVEFIKLLNSRGITLLRPTEDEVQRVLEGAAFRTEMIAAKK
jgi:hypothetical protein